VKRRRHALRKATSRTTVTLPAASLEQARQVARARNVNLSTVVAEALAESLRQQDAARRPERILESYRQTFRGLTPKELLAVDGVILESDE
jgi:post-segregation antitoxin (ccd killing protein)